MAEWIQSIGKITVPTPLPIGDVNLYLLKGDTLTLVDAGIKTEAAWTVFKQELKQLGYLPSDIEQVVLTHHHTDHVGFLDYMPNVKIFGHEYGRKWIKKDRSFMEETLAFFSKVYKQFGIPKKYDEGFSEFHLLAKLACGNQELTDDLSEGMTIPGHLNWYVIETPGHSQSQLSFYNELEGLLIGGDHILASMLSNPVLEPPLDVEKERPMSQIDYLHSLKKVKQLPLDIVFAGHGPEVKQVHALIDRRLTRFHEFAMNIKDELMNHPMTVFELCKSIFPKSYEKNISMTISQTVGYLDYLHSLGEVQIMDEHDIQYFVRSNKG